VMSGQGSALDLYTRSDGQKGQHNEHNERRSKKIGYTHRRRPSAA